MASMMRRANRKDLAQRKALLDAGWGTSGT